MSKQVQAQAAKLWQTLSDPGTAATYQTTLSLTWKIFAETGRLLWLVICLVLVFGEWIWKTGYRLGWGVRNWVNGLEKPSADRLLSETGKNLLEAGKAGAVMALATAKEQLGIEDTSEPLLVSPPPVAKPAPTPVPVVPVPPVTVTPVATKPAVADPESDPSASEESPN